MRAMAVLAPDAVRRIIEATRRSETHGREGKRGPERLFRGGGKVNSGTENYQVLTTLVDAQGNKSIVWNFVRAHD